MTDGKRLVGPTVANFLLAGFLALALLALAGCGKSNLSTGTNACTKIEESFKRNNPNVLGVLCLRKQVPGN